MDNSKNNPMYNTQVSEEREEEKEEAQCEGHQALSYPQEFVHNGSVVKKSMDIANGLKKFFVDIGQNLAKNIEPPSENVTVENYLGNCNTQSIFLSSVEESSTL